MKTEIAIDGTGFVINGAPSYPGVFHRDRRIEGLLFNSRMVQALFDDENPVTRELWKYPDTGKWNPDRNTNEFCAMLPAYRSHGLLAVTVGLQGGGSIYRPEVYGQYVNTAFTPAGEFKKPYFDRLLRVLEAADNAGMVVIVNYFYVAHMRKFPEAAVHPLIEKITAWLLQTGYRNILVDVANESAPWWKYPVLEPGRIHQAIETAKGVTVNGRRLLVSVSTAGGDQIPEPAWVKAGDFALPHGNGCMPGELRAKIRRIREVPEYRKRPCPIVVNEDTVHLDNLEAAVEEYASWGFYHQGYGSGYADRTDWKVHGRETRYEDLSGFQTVPVNWSINDDFKKAFFNRIREMTGGRRDVA